MLGLRTIGRGMMKHSKLDQKWYCMYVARESCQWYAKEVLCNVIDMLKCIDYMLHDSKIMYV